MCGASSICVHDFRPATLDILPANQLMHGWAGGINRVKNNEVAVTVTAAFETDDSEGVAGSLEVNRG